MFSLLRMNRSKYILSFFFSKESNSEKLENQLSKEFPHSHTKLYLIMSCYII